MNSKENYKKTVYKSALYEAIDKLLYKELEKITKQIQNYLDLKKLDLEVFWYKSTYTPWYIPNDSTDWILKIDFENYQWSYRIAKPHWLYITILHLEELVEEQKIIITKTNGEINNSFTIDLSLKKEDDKNPKTELSINELEDKNIINTQLQEINNCFKTLYDQFIKEIDFIDTNDLEKYEDSEILEMDTEILNDEKEAILELLKSKDIKETDFLRIAEYYDEIKDYKKAITYYSKHLKFTFDERSKQRIQELKSNKVSKRMYYFYQ